MTDKPDIATAAEKAAETFNLNLKRSCEAISLNSPKIDVEHIYEMPKIAGMNIDYLLNSEPHIGEMADFTRTLVGNIDAYARACCYEVHIDPNALVNQAKLISDLRKALDILGKNYVGCYFSEYLRLIDENERLKAEIIRLQREKYNGT